MIRRLLSQTTVESPCLGPGETTATRLAATCCLCSGVRRSAVRLLCSAASVWLPSALLRRRRPGPARGCVFIALIPGGPCAFACDYLQLSSVRVRVRPLFWYPIKDKFWERRKRAELVTGVKVLF